MKALGLVALGGCLGALLRFGITTTLFSFYSAKFLGTLLANALGCFLIGYLSGRGALSPMVGKFLIVGFLGSLTTFSTFQWEGFILLEKSLLLSLTYLLGSLILGFTLVTLGFWLGGGKITWI